MTSSFKYLFALLIASILIMPEASAQYTTKKIKSKHQVYTDSLKQMDYPYIFPILGQGAYKKGFDIPYPVGIMANYLYMTQGLMIDNFQLGLKSDNQDIPLTPVDFIEFGDNYNTSNGYNFRPDIWIFPFLNVYGIFGSGQSKTEVNLISPIPLNSVVEQKINTAGFGVMTAMGLGPVWMSVDANFTWSKPELLDDPVRVNVLGLRFGHTFTNKNKPYRNFAIWAGGMRMAMNTKSSGQIQLKDALGPEVWERRDEFVQDYNDWYNSLDPSKPLDKIKIDKADEILAPIVDRIENADGSSIVRYGMDKQVKELWNGVIGAQYQLNKNWIFRTEGGLIGDRKSMMLSVNYRFKI